jgi:hypothetical protein
MEDFPALPVTEKKFEITKDSFSMARSSASTTSIGATEAELDYKLTPGEYVINDSFDLRPKLFCTCRKCKTKYPTVDTFGECEKAFAVGHTKFKCRVTDSKVIRNGAEHFSVSYIKSRVDMRDKMGYAHRHNGQKLCIQGWVKSKYLSKMVRASLSVEPEFRRCNAVDRSRSPSVLADSQFQFGDLVLVNVDGRDKWVRGEVRQERPLLILVDGKAMPEPFHISNIKDHPTRDFVTTKDLFVRRNKFRGDWSPETIEAGTTIKVAYMDGYEGRVVAPLQGWVTMRDSYYSGLNVVEKDWTLTTEKVVPTTIVTNLPDTITETSLRTHLFLKCFVNAKDIMFQRKGEEFRAVVTFSENFEAVSKAVEQKTSEFHCGWNLSMRWTMLYLKNRAKTIVDAGFEKESKA